MRGVVVWCRLPLEHLMKQSNYALRLLVLLVLSGLIGFGVGIVVAAVT